MIRKAHASFLLELDKVNHHIGLVVADRNGDVTLVNDAEGYGSIRRARAYLFNIRNTQDYQHPTVVVLVTGTLVGIADI